MRQYIINQLHSRVMNADETANLEYPVWKRRALMVGVFVALRLWSLVTFAMIPFVILFAIGLYTFEAIKKILVESFIYVGRDTFRANYRNLKADIRGLRNIWKGEYGRGKLRIKNPTGKPTRIPG
jgi:hypothetical protein